MHSSCRFSGNPMHPARTWQVPIELLRERAMFGHAAHFHQAFLCLGQVGGLPPRHQNRKVKTFRLHEALLIDVRFTFTWSLMCTLWDLHAGCIGICTAKPK